MFLRLISPPTEQGHYVMGVQRRGMNDMEHVPLAAVLALTGLPLHLLPRSLSPCPPFP